MSRMAYNMENNIQSLTVGKMKKNKVLTLK